MPDNQDQALLQDFRKLFNDKSKKALQKAFVQLGSVVYSSGGSIKLSFNLMEFKIALYKNYKHVFNFEQIKRIFLLLDANGSGRIEFDEFADGIRVSISYTLSNFIRLSSYNLYILSTNNRENSANIVSR
jgi:Ca2+-binding EF-hand superfamily protein